MSENNLTVICNMNTFFSRSVSESGIGLCFISVLLQYKDQALPSSLFDKVFHIDEIAPVKFEKIGPAA
jgi:hypothetical protein